MQALKLRHGEPTSLLCDALKVRLTTQRHGTLQCEISAHKRVPVEAKRLVRRVSKERSLQRVSATLFSCERLLDEPVQVCRVDRRGVGRTAGD